jgi:hypothetical protein
VSSHCIGYHTRDGTKALHNLTYVTSRCCSPLSLTVKMSLVIQCFLFWEEWEYCSLPLMLVFFPMQPHGWPKPNPGRTRQAESRLVQVPDGRGLLLGRRCLGRGGWSDCLGRPRHLPHRSIIQATRDPSQLFQLQHTSVPRLRPHSERMPRQPSPDGKKWQPGQAGDDEMGALFVDKYSRDTCRSSPCSSRLKLPQGSEGDC